MFTAVSLPSRRLEPSDDDESLGLDMYDVLELGRKKGILREPESIMDYLFQQGERDGWDQLSRSEWKGRKKKEDNNTNPNKSIIPGGTER